MNRAARSFELHPYGFDEETKNSGILAIGENGDNGDLYSLSCPFKYKTYYDGEAKMIEVVTGVAVIHSYKKGASVSRESVEMYAESISHITKTMEYTLQYNVIDKEEDLFFENDIALEHFSRTRKRLKYQRFHL